MRDHFLQFFYENWPEISLLNHNSDNIFHFLDDIKKDVFWSCFFPPQLVKELYSKNSIGNKDFKSFIPGNIYTFEIMDHEFVIIYKNIGELYYMDYYIETERQNVFRIEKLDLVDLERYIQNYKNGNFVEHSKFHHGNKTYMEDYKRNFLLTVKKFGESNIYTNMQITEYKIIADPTPILLLSFLENNIKSIEFNSNESAREIINFRYRNLIANTIDYYMKHDII